MPPFAAAGVADSFFDVFFEVEVMGQLLHTHEPKRMRSVIRHKPPKDRYRNVELLNLFDENENQTGIVIGGAAHIPFPEEEEREFSTIIEELTFTDVFVRIEAAAELAEFGPEAAEAVPDLIRAMQDEDARLREQAARTLGAIGPGAEEAVPVLNEALKDPDENVRQAAAEALERILGE